ncbi:sensor domain-containing protein [Paenibacillus sp. HW567]|uniref:sensor domain-containing protein n=1 Tax=Paenibacillus sp. HW567 TaxID=1034769 RepID=UPI0003807DB7|nr:sensor domain-containing protein [Paenibacillus sp. HW567]
MKKQSSVKAWTLLVMSLPKGIAAFVIAVAGVCVSVPLIIVWVGLPLLAATLAACRRMMVQEEQVVEGWIQGDHGQPARTDGPVPQRGDGWRSVFTLLGQGQTYRGIIYSLAQLPIGIAGFTFAIVLPATAFGVLLSPLAYLVSDRLFSFELFSYDNTWRFLLSDMSSYERSWVAGGIGLVLVLLLPLILRKLGRLYAAWVRTVSST